MVIFLLPNFKCLLIFRAYKTQKDLQGIINPEMITFKK